MPRHIKKKTITLIVSLVLVLLAPLISKYGPAIPALQANQPGLYAVAQFYDGDTISVYMNGTQEKVRFIGVDTPETHDPRKAVQCYGKAASNFTQNIIGVQSVRLEADPLNTNRDRYNRLLRYVYLPNGTLVNAEIIKQGYGFAYTGFPFSKADEFVRYQTEAREAERGLWKDCNPTKNQYGGYTSNNAP